MSNPVRVGLDNLVIWQMTDEEAETYGSVMPLPEIKTADINPRTSSDPEYADDVQVDELESLDGIDVAIESRYLTTEAEALIHGHSVDDKGVLVKKDGDKAPFLAIAFRSKKRDGTYKYYMLPKCKAKLGQEKFKTGGGKKEVQNKMTTFTAMPRKRDKQWELSANEGDKSIGAEVIQNWFKVPYGETSPS